MNKKIILAIAYVAGLLIAYLLFIDYNLAQYREYNEIQKTKWIARGFSPEFYDGYVREGFISTAYGRNVINLAPVLIFVGIIGAFILSVISKALSNRKEQQRKQKNTRARIGP